MKQLILLLILVPFLGLSQVQIGQTINGSLLYDSTGANVALSSDGNTMIIGAPSNDYNGLVSGQVEVYKNENGSWIQLGESFYGQEDINPGLGSSVAISADGNIIAFGILYADDNNLNSGRIEVYEFQNENWVQLGQPIYGEGYSERFGRKLSISDDGNFIITGSKQVYNEAEGVTGGEHGRVRVYENQGGNWTQIGQDLYGILHLDALGSDVSISADGSTIAVSALQVTPRNGFVRIYTIQNNIWTQVGEDITGYSPFDRFGISISLSADGSIVAIGAPFYTSIGSVRVYENQNESWMQLGQDINGIIIENEFGSSISLSADGTRLAIGAPGDKSAVVDNFTVNNVKIYDFENGDWEKNLGTIYYTYDNYSFGSDVSLSSDGTKVAIVIPTIDDYWGEVQVFDLTVALSVNDALSSNFVLFPNPAKHQVTIRLNDLSTLEKVMIYNTLGQKILTSKAAIVNTSKLTSGVYVVEITTNKGKASKTLIVE